MSVEKTTDRVNVSGESRDNGDQCITEKIKSSPHTITGTSGVQEEPSVLGLVQV